MSSEEPQSEKPNLIFKHDWYQTETTVVITILVKSLSQETFKIAIQPESITIDITLDSYKEFHRKFNLLHNVVAEQCTHKITPSKVEIKLVKRDGVRWEQLEATEARASTTDQKPPSYPTSKLGKDWNAIEKNIKQNEAQEKPEGEEALNQMFKEIYGKGNDEVKRAMNKSFMESGGTVLSTNWNEISKKTVEVKPPDGTEFKKWD